MEFVGVLVNINDLYSIHSYNCKSKTMCKLNKLFLKLLIKSDLLIEYKQSSI